jgi:hypothetical protein
MAPPRQAMLIGIMGGRHDVELLPRPCCWIAFTAISDLALVCHHYWHVQLKINVSLGLLQPSSSLVSVLLMSGASGGATISWSYTQPPSAPWEAS